jgi:hypothetical protein
LTRGVDPRAGGGRVRYSAYTITDDELDLQIPTPATSGPGGEDLPRLTFLAAGQENQKVPEVDLLDTQGHPSPRGALSWAFARALEGQADQDGDARLTRDEINRFVRANVRAIAEARQTPNLLPMSDEGRVVLPVVAATRSATLAVHWPEARVRILASDERSAAALAGELTGIARVAEGEDADLILDLRARQAISGQGDVLARDLVRPALQTLIDKWRGLEKLKFERLGDRLTMRVLPNDGTPPPGPGDGLRDRRHPPALSGVFQPLGRRHPEFPLPLAGGSRDRAHGPAGQGRFQGHATLWRGSHHRRGQRPVPG